jgi:hypothetical protein
MLIEDEHRRNSVNVIGEAKLHTGASNIIFNQGLLRHVTNSFNQACRYFVSFQRQPALHSYLGSPKSLNQNFEKISGVPL